MGRLQGSDQDNDIRWKTVLNQDEGGSHSPALNRPHASKSANSGLSVRRQPIYPPSDLPSAVGSDSLPVHRKVASDVSTLPEDAKPFVHLRSSMGRLSLQYNGIMVGRTPLGVIHESTTAEHLDGEEKDFGQGNDVATGSALIPETHSPLSIRNHIKAQLKATDQDRNGMRIRRSQELVPDNTLRAANRRTTRQTYSNHCPPTGSLKMENKAKIPETGNITTGFQRRKQIQVLGEPATIPRYDMTPGHGYGSPLDVLVLFYSFPSAPSAEKSSALSLVYGSQ